MEAEHVRRGDVRLDECSLEGCHVCDVQPNLLSVSKGGWVNSLLGSHRRLTSNKEQADTGMEAEAWRLWRLRSSMSCSICVVLP